MAWHGRRSLVEPVPRTYGTRRSRALLLLLSAGVWALSGCTTPSSPRVATSESPQATRKPMPTAVATATTPSPTATPIAPTGPAATVEGTPTAVYGFTHQQPDGNRVVEGQGAVPEVTPVDVPLAGEPHWLVAVPLEGGSAWAAVMADGRVHGFQALGQTVEQMVIEPDQLPAGMPPLLSIEDGTARLVTAPSDVASTLSPPMVLDSRGRLAFIEQNGDLVIWEDGEVGRLAVNALPDARLLRDEAKRLLLLAAGTTRYSHGVLGDQVEAAAITLVETEPKLRLVLNIRLPEPQVVEGIAPIWADVDGDGEREIIVTVSDADQGAQVIMFSEAGERTAASPAIGRGFRWRHQLAVAPFGPQGTLELVSVLTPHIGGVVEFFAQKGDNLSIEAQVAGFSSHSIGSRNLDMALAGDFDGDGQVELLLPSQGQTELGGIQCIAEGAEVAWTVPVGGRVSTNLAAVTLSDGKLAVGVGQAEGVLRLWLP